MASVDLSASENVHVWFNTAGAGGTQLVKYGSTPVTTFQVADDGTVTFKERIEKSGALVIQNTSSTGVCTFQQQSTAYATVDYVASQLRWTFNSGRDLLLKSSAGIVVNLDTDADTAASNFRIVDSAANPQFRVYKDGGTEWFDTGGSATVDIGYPAAIDALLRVGIPSDRRGIVYVKARTSGESDGEPVSF